MEDFIGRTLGDFQLVSLLGEGGIGSVYKARDLNEPRVVAVKVIRPQFARRPEFKGAFLRAAERATGIAYPGILPVIGYGNAASLYCAAEFASGKNLRQMVRSLRATDQWLLLTEVMRIVKHISIALHYARTEHDVFYDIRPNNIMLTMDPSEGLPFQPLLTDLDLVKLLHRGGIGHQGGLVDALAYISPEQAMGQVTDARSDVYSLGILLYELTTSQLPFPIRTVTDAIRYHTREAPPSPRSIRPDMTVQTETIILRALAKSPSSRYSSPDALAQALDEILPTMRPEDALYTRPLGSISLTTQIEDSPVEVRQRAAATALPTEGVGDRISLMRADGAIQTIDMANATLTIGRAPENDLSLKYADVSRYHARIEFDGKEYIVTDLSSTNGSYLGSSRLTPGVAEVWLVGQPLRIGGSWLQLERAEQARQETMFRTDGTVVDPEKINWSEQSGRLGIYLETPKRKVEPGGRVTIAAIVLNRGQESGDFTARLLGIPENWVSESPISLSLLPNQQHILKFFIQPPRSVQSRADDYHFSIQMMGHDMPPDAVEANGMLSVIAYTQFRSELWPPKIQAGKKARVTIENLGNSEEKFTVTLSDPDGELLFQPNRIELKIPRGAQAAAEFKAAPRQSRWFGAAQTFPVHIEVKSASGEQHQHISELVSKGRLPL